MKRMEERQLPGELQRLLVAYGAALPDREPTADFMPKLWVQIDSRRKATHRFGVFARVFVTAGATMCLLMSVVLVRPQPASPPSDTAWVEVLADAHSDEGPELEAIRDHI